MIPDHEWDLISKKAFPARAVKAPAFLWTRVLSRITPEEARRASSWWMQWRLILKVTFAVGFFAMARSYYLYDQAPGPLDSAWTTASLDRAEDLSEEYDS